MNRAKHFTFGLAFIVVFALVIALTVALYKGSFTSTDPLSLRTERAGLTMDQGAAVKLRGVEIGRVSSVSSVSDGARVELEIQSRYMKRIPADVSAQIIPPTAFGAKYVELDAATGPVTDPIKAGATIGAGHVTVEVNDTFEHLMDVLHAVNPLQLNNALSAIAGGLDGRGAQLGSLIAQIDTYLSGLNPSLPQLSDDLPKLASVLGTYSALTPDLLRLARNATVTSNSVVRKQASLDALLLSLTSFSRKTSTFLTTNAQPLQNLLAYLDPVTRAVARYAPVLPCTFSGLVVAEKLAERAVGGQGPGVYTYTELQPSDDPYTTAANLPKLGEDSGPDCHGLPNLTGGARTADYPAYDTGANPATPNTTTSGKTSGSTLATTLFGTLAGLLNVAGQK